VSHALLALVYSGPRLRARGTDADCFLGKLRVQEDYCGGQAPH